MIDENMLRRLILDQQLEGQPIEFAQKLRELLIFVRNNLLSKIS